MPYDPQVMSFDVFGTLIDVRAGSYDAFGAILASAGAAHVDVREFWEDWEHRNIRRYWEPYRPYREICRASLAETFAAHGIDGDPDQIERYFEAFARFPLYPDVADCLKRFKARARLAVISNIDDDLLAATPLPDLFDLVCTAERARGYKPDGALFKYFIGKSGVPLDRILHSGQSQFTDLVGGKPLGLTIAWVNRRGVPLSGDVPRPDAIVSGLDELAALLVS